MAGPQQVDSADITNDMHHRYQKWCPMHICTEQTGTTNMRTKLRIKGKKKNQVLFMYVPSNVMLTDGKGYIAIQVTIVYATTTA